MISTQRLIRDLALAHGVDAETIVRAAVVDFALGRSERQQADAIRTALAFDAPQGDKKRHSTSEAVTKIVTGTNHR
jgi:hypothetical protein